MKIADMPEWYRILILVYLSITILSIASLLVSGSIGLLYFVIAISILMGGIAKYLRRSSAKCILTDDYMYIKGVDKGLVVDFKIHYRDILSFYIYAVPHKIIPIKTHKLDIVYWIDDRAYEFYISLSPFTNSDKLRENVEAKRKEYDLSHIISPQYLDKFDNVLVMPEDLSFMDYSQLDDNIMIALLQDGERIVLLNGCYAYEKQEFINTTPPDMRSIKYITCGLIHIRHLKYRSIDEALSDEKWSSSLRKNIRAIDEIAHN